MKRSEKRLEKIRFTEKWLGIKNLLPVNYAAIIAHNNPNLSKNKIYRVKNYGTVDWDIMAEFEKLVSKNLN